MSTITREHLEQLASGNAWVCVQDDEVAELARIALASLEAEKMTLYRERNPYNGMTTGWQELTEQEYEFVKGNASDNAEFRTVFTAPPAPVVPDGYAAAADTGIPIESVCWQLVPAVQDDGRKQFEEWFKFHYGEDGSIMKLHRANGGANYRDPYVDLAWIAWKDSRAAMLQGAEPVSNRDELPDGWVACSERLPPEGYEPDGGAVCYLVWHKNEVDCGPQYSISNVFFLRKHWERNFTHWMPLPAAPKQEVK